MRYKSCSKIEKFCMNFDGRIDLGEKCIMLCCEMIDNIPGTMLFETAEQSVEAFRRQHAEVIAETIKLGLCGGSDDERIFTAGCAKCANFLEGDYNSDGLIHCVNLSMYPAPCQCKCIYCDFRRDGFGTFNKRLHAQYYEKLFDMLDYAQRSELIAQDAFWQVSSGEITIHPYKDRILNLVKNQRVSFSTNCFIFDEKIAENLEINPRSGINISIDSGTSKTWHKVKGVDNFDLVMDNLIKYFKCCSSPDQMVLKYIILPGINDNLDDYVSIIEIMKRLKVKKLDVSRDVRIKYTPYSKEQKDILIGSVAYLTAMLYKSGMTLDLFMYTPDERKRILAFANELLMTGQV